MEHEDNISKVRSRTLTKKLGNSNEEYITLNEINDLIFSLNLHNIITKDEATIIRNTHITFTNLQYHFELSSARVFIMMNYKNKKAHKINCVLRALFREVPPKADS